MYTEILHLEKKSNVENEFSFGKLYDKVKTIVITAGFSYGSFLWLPPKLVFNFICYVLYCDFRKYNQQLSSETSSSISKEILENLWKMHELRLDALQQMDNCFRFVLGTTIFFITSNLCLIVYLVAVAEDITIEGIILVQSVCFTVGLCVTGIVPMLVNTEVGG